MPRKQRRVSAFFKILAVLTVTCGLLLAGGYYAITSLKPLEVAEPEPTESCTITGNEDTHDIDVEQAANAATVNGVAFSLDMPEDAVVIAYATVWQESKFINIEYGDRDSLGLFQQRPSQEWGEPDQIMDQVFATRSFYEELKEVPDYQEMPVYEAAQAVQRSADGFAYDQHEDLSRVMAAAFNGSEGPAVSCWYEPETSAKSDVAGAKAELERVFGTAPDDLPVADGPQTGEIGWSMAVWAVANARDYGLRSVTYGDQRWRAAAGEDGWSTVPDGAARATLVLK
ncbi:hypothetical protein CDO52_07640 [Nocardiopsis gilva YIM 90087]|uniref:Heavy metal transporter n=1 Tax=Nocardiopsis gilva YIM 90087 TaxID=1235441 RepID=A0A223S3M4_9ACTN|nr:hypothetical protein [Nocardiopsis gilva]ASU82677.1 hypothetical protein CDO52_07640 [Nocardiopsis gilva YIM 90087]